MDNELSNPLILALADDQATLELVGGKGASLARMAAADLPVPPGFHITTAAYARFVHQNGLQAKILAAVTSVQADQPTTLTAAAQQIEQLFTQYAMPTEIDEAIRRAYASLGSGDLPVAVRSSATAEDLPDLSFAGQQESYLNQSGAAMVLDAVKRCWASLWTARAIGYRARHNIAPDDVRLAVVVQTLVDAEAAGILFTANPLTGVRNQMVINAAWGLGEAIVGGQVTPDSIVVDKASGAVIEQQINEKSVMTVRTPTGTQEAAVPDNRRRQAVLRPAQVAELAQIGKQIENFYGQPMDIEWAMHASQFAIVQARPITTLRDEGEGSREKLETWNDSLKGDYLWTNANLGEAVPDVMTPCTWSLFQIFIANAMAATTIGDYPMVGNIGGRLYMNLSLTTSLAAAFGMRKRADAVTAQVFGRLPDGLETPLLPISRWQILRLILPVAVRLRRRVSANQKQLATFLATAPAHCDRLHAQIQQAMSTTDLVGLWQTEVGPFLQTASQMLEAAGRQDGNALVWIRHDLNKRMGEADASAMITGLQASGSQLASMGPLLGLEQLARGEIDRATYAQRYGHRGPHEFEVARARPAEDPDWIDKQLAGLRSAQQDVTALLARQAVARDQAWARFAQRYPRQVSSMRRKFERWAAVARDRETARSEVIRAFWVLRAFVLRAGALTGQGEALFFLSIDEILTLLGGIDTPLAHLPVRRATYARYNALPPYPTLIRGAFDPFRWAADPQRRSDLFDASDAHPPTSAAITGFPGATGIVEGRVRVIDNVDEADSLQAGEILVTTVTNIGWTPLFPRAAAVVTDVGAPLSHAAIVARELGIPAVVGCGNATMRLHTGDWVRVDGEQGTVTVLQAADG